MSVEEVVMNEKENRIMRMDECGKNGLDAWTEGISL